jgi:osmoprotectant transport system permease protein
VRRGGERSSPTGFEPPGRRRALAPGLAPALLAVAGIASSALLPFYELRPNRIAQGRGIFLVQAEPLALLALALAWSLFFLLSLRGSRSASIAATGAAVIALIATGFAGPRLAGSNHIARLGLGAGFWLLCLAAYAAYLLPSRGEASGRSRALSLACMASVALALAVLLGAGSFDSLSILREWSSRSSAFAAELRRHAVLTMTSALAGALIGAAIGGAAARGKAAKSGGFFFLNIVQTIPSLALFGLLVIPLAALADRFPLLRSWGIGGIGAAPALIALSLYAALPVARNTYAGLVGVPAAALDAGRGMGMGKAQLFFRVELPLALPVAVAGFRTAVVQAVGNCAVAALIGAGGLGVFIFQGLGQFAMDMVLLGTLPVIAMALAADALLGALARAITPRGLRASAAQAKAAA